MADRPAEQYVCPQCGSAPEGEEEHARRAHTIAGVLDSRTSNERSLLDDTRKLLRGMRDEHIEHGELSGRTQRSADDLLRRIDSHLATPVETECDWQPIETAPKEGCSFLVWCAERQNTYVVFRKPSEGEKFWHFGSGWYDLQETPTHWRPLPASPVKTSESHYCIDHNEAHDPRTCGTLEPLEKCEHGIPRKFCTAAHEEKP